MVVGGGVGGGGVGGTSVLSENTVLVPFSVYNSLVFSNIVMILSRIIE